MSQMLRNEESDDTEEDRTSLNRFRIEDKFSDINVTIGGKKFACHRIILAWQSRYFEAILNVNPSTSDIVGNTVLEEIGAEIFEVILNFIYTNSGNIKKQNAFRLYKFANKLGVVELEKKVVQFIKVSSLKVGHQIDACELALNLQNLSLVDALCRRLARKTYFEDVMLNKRYANLPYEIFRKIITHAEPSDESRKMDAILQWINVNAERKPLVMELFTLVDAQKISSGKLQKWYREIHRNSPVPQNAVPVRKSGKRKQSGDITEESSTSDIAKKLVVLPAVSVSQNVNRLKVYAETFFGRCLHALNVFSFEDDEWRWLQAQKIDVTCKRLRSVYVNGCEHFLTFGYQMNDTRGRNSFWLVNEEGHKRNLRPPPIIVQNYRLTALNKELMLYDVNCTIDDQSVMLYNCDMDMWLPVKTPMALYNAAVAESNGKYYVCGGTTDGSNANKKAYFYDRRLSTWIDLPELIHQCENAVGCSHKDQIYVYGGCRGEFAMFDPTAYKWRSLCVMKHSALVQYWEKFLISNCNDVLLMDLNGRNTNYSVINDTWFDINQFPVNSRVCQKKVTSVRVKDVVREWSL